jgi:GntR family transcriptional regulator
MPVTSIAPGPLPRYLQIAETLARDIAAGRLADGTRLPTERMLAADLGVAVGTLRQALADLADRGLLRRVQGSGNYVRARPDAPGIYAFFRLERVAGGPGLPRAEVLAFDRLPRPAPPPPPGPAPEAHRIRRLRRLSGAPAAVEEIWLDAARTPGLTAADLSEALYLTLSTRFGLTIARVEDRLGQSPAPDWAPAPFAPPPGTPLPRIDRLAFDPEGRPVETSTTWLDPAVAAYVNRIGP